MRVMLFSLAVQSMLAGACGPSVEEPEHSGSGDGGGMDTSDDDAGMSDSGNPYDGCVWFALGFYYAERTPCSSAFTVEVPGTCGACACSDAKCDRDSDCPAASTGQTTPTCDHGNCVLPCEDDGDCPDEMRCGSSLVGGSRVCAEALEDPLACATHSPDPWPDPCPAFSDEASCEVLTSDLGFACKWSTLRLYQTPADDCTPVEETQSCIMTARSGGMIAESGVCDPFGLCAASGTRVFFEDVGAGTVRLIAYDDCELYLTPHIYTGNPVEPCDYSGTTPLPNVCDCACG